MMSIRNEKLVTYKAVVSDRFFSTKLLNVHDNLKIYEYLQTLKQSKIRHERSNIYWITTAQSYITIHGEYKASNLPLYTRRFTDPIWRALVASQSEHCVGQGFSFDAHIEIPVKDQMKNITETLFIDEM